MLEGMSLSSYIYLVIACVSCFCSLLGVFIHKNMWEMHNPGRFYPDLIPKCFFAIMCSGAWIVTLIAVAICGVLFGCYWVIDRIAKGIVNMFYDRMQDKDALNKLHRELRK